MWILIFSLAIFVACMAFLFSEGMWGNAITLVNVIVAGLVAGGYWQVLSGFLASSAPSYSFMWPFLSIWAVFALTMLIMKLLTDRISKVKVRFIKIVDRVGGLVFAALVGFVMVGFSLASLHMAPLAKVAFGGSFDTKGKSGTVMGMSPDRAWLGFAGYVSNGAFAPLVEEDCWKKRGFACPPTDVYVKEGLFLRSCVQSHLEATGRLRMTDAHITEFRKEAALRTRSGSMKPPVEAEPKEGEPEAGGPETSDPEAGNPEDADPETAEPGVDEPGDSE